MNFTNSQRPRVRGKPFRLFTDDLPKVDFNRFYLHDDHDTSGADSRIPDYALKARQRQIGTHFDQFSLPSIGSTSWDRLTPEPRRPRSHVNVLNPNIAQVNKKIRRRHTVKERGEKITLDDRRFHRASEPFHDKDNAERTAESVTDAFVRKPSTRSVRSKSSKNDGVEDTEEAENPKSILQQLLAASAKETARRKMVEDGFKLFTQNKPNVKVPRIASNILSRVNVKKETKETAQIAHPIANSVVSRDNVKKETSEAAHKESKALNLPVSTDDIQVQHSQTKIEKSILTTVGDKQVEEIPSNTVTETHGVTVKPGILKYNAGINGPKIKHEQNLKPRLIHQEDVNIFSNPGDSGGEVNVTVHAEVPLTRLNALVFEREHSHKPRTKRRVNFHQGVEDEKSGVLVNGNTEINCTDTKYKDIGNRNGKELSDTSKDTIAFQRYALPSIKKRDSSRRKTINRIPGLKPIHRSSFTTYNRETVKEQASCINNTSPKFEKVTENLKDPREDPFWKEVKEPVEDTRVSDANESVRVAGANEPVSQKTEAGETPVSVKPNVLLGLTPTGVSPGNTGQLRRPRSSRKAASITGLYTPSDTVSTGSILSTDLDSLADVESLFGDIDVEEHVNRGLLGEDLIKAYRLWDRKRKVFPGGVRKIEEPSDRPEDYVFPKAFGAVRTYKIPTQTQEIKSSTAETSEPMNSVFIGSF